MEKADRFSLMKKIIDKKRKRTKETGFTLIEILVTVTVLSIGLLGVATMQIAAIRGNSSARGTSEALSVAEEKMEGLISAPFDPPYLPGLGLDDVNGDGAAGLDNPTVAQLRAGGNVLLSAGGAGQPDYCEQVIPDPADPATTTYFLYWNIDQVNNTRKDIRVIVAWHDRGMHRADFTYVKNN